VAQTEDSIVPDLHRFLKLARSQKYEELDAAWIRAIEGDLFALDDLLSVVREVARRSDSSLAAARQVESMLWFLLTLRAERGGPEAGLEVVRALGDLLPESDILREEIAGLYRKAHATVGGIQAMTEMTVLRADVPLRAGVACMERLLTLSPGAFVLDLRLDKAGRVLGLSEAEKLLRVQFPNGERAYDADAVTHLEPLAPDDFRVLAAFDRARLEAMAVHDPGEFVRLALRAFGPRLPLKEFKARVACIIPSSGWTKWWAKSQTQIRRSPLVEISEGTQPELFLRRGAVAYEERVRSLFDSASDTERLTIVLDYLGTSTIPAEAVPMLAEWADKLARVADSCARSDPALALGALAIQAKISHLTPTGQPAGTVTPEIARKVDQILSNVADLSTLLSRISDERVQKLSLSLMREALPDAWPEVYAAVLPGCLPEVCEWAAGELLAANQQESLVGAVQTILQRPTRYVGGLIWTWRAATGGRLSKVLARVDHLGLAMRLFTTAGELARDPARKPLLAQVRSAIWARNGELLREMLRQADNERLLQICHVVENNPGLSEHTRSQILALIRELQPEMFETLLPPWEQDVIYTTEAGLRRRQAEFEELCHVKIPANARAIGQARAHGDLRENAEYKAALEERDRLYARAAEMERELKKARLIIHGRETPDCVTIGSTVRAQNVASGAVETFVFLGPWDADRAKGIYSYRSPIGIAFMGKKRGDTVVLRMDDGETRWEIVEVA